MFLQEVARLLSESFILIRGKDVWQRNQLDWYLPLSRLDKLLCGMYLIINDYAYDKFPPTFQDQQKAYDAEINYMFTLPGVSREDAIDSQMRKPFWYGRDGRDFLNDFIKLMNVFEIVGIKPPQRLLELGCGTGWMAEFLAMMKFDVIATSISQYEINIASNRIQSLADKDIKFNLKYMTVPMENVDKSVNEEEAFDVVFVYEALHHAYDWKKAVSASYKCLKPDGWLVLCNEPNLIHTFISYRVAKLTNTHEIGFKRSDLRKELLRIGYQKITYPINKYGFLKKPLWIAAQK
jgi:2-polyprenyl-3-methyl-5-hydroxy-6-metoxy-1,4-benzoquinol methylase